MRLPYGFHPLLNGFFPYGGFPVNPNKKGKVGHIGSQKKKRILMMGFKKGND